jgi:hypothetical protein
VPDFNLEKAAAYADRQILPRFYASLSQRSPLFAFMVALGGRSRDLLRPNAMGILAGSKNPDFIKQYVDGSIHADVRILTGRSGGGRTRRAFGTNPAVNVSQDQLLGSARFWWWFYAQPLKIFKSTLRKSGRGQYRFRNAMDDSIVIGTDEMVDTLSAKLYTGAPSTYDGQSTDDEYDDLPGIYEAMSSTNTYGNIDRTDTTKYVDGRHPWTGNRITAARAASLSLIDEANSYCQLRGPGVNLVVCDRASYLAIKPEALGKGGAIVHNGVIPGHGMVGYQNEFVMYGKTMITWDPFNTAGYVACMTTQDWIIQVHGEDKGTTSNWVDNNKPGEDDAITAQINIGLRPMCAKPCNQLLYTNVSAA